MKYLHDDNKNRIEGLSKEEIYNFVSESLQHGQVIPAAEDTAFVTMIKSVVDDRTYQIAFCTQAKYNELENAGEIIADCLYVITDDSTYDDLVDVIEALQTNVANLESELGHLSITVEHMEEDRLLTRTLINENTDTNYHNISSGYYDWTVENPVVAHNEYLYVLKTVVRYKATYDGSYTNYDLTPFIFDAVTNGVNTTKNSIQYIVIPSVGLIEINAEYRSGLLEVYARLINLSTFAKETFGYLEMKVLSFKAVANWKD